MSDDIIFTSDTDSTSYIESLIKSQEHILLRRDRTKLISKQDKEQLDKLHEVIMAELDLALLGAEKAKSDLLKSNKDSVVKPIK